MTDLSASQKHCTHTTKLQFSSLQTHVSLFCRQLQGGELEDEFIKSCRIRTGRSVRGFCLPPAMCRAERRSVEKVTLAPGDTVETSHVCVCIGSYKEVKQNTALSEHVPQLTTAMKTTDSLDSACFFTKDTLPTHLVSALSRALRNGMQ